MSETNKVRYGLSNVHVGTLTIGEDGTPTFSVPKAYPGAVNLTLDAEGEQSVFYADNIAYFVTSSNNGYTGELEMAYLYDWFETEYLGAIVSKEGMIVETSNLANTLAYMMFQFEGDKNATKYIIYNTTFGRPSLEGSTKEDTTEPNTTTIPFTSVPLVTEFGNIVRAKVPSTASNYDKFFTTAPTVPTEKS
nr:MAG TPA: tail tube protein [Caudoviricetes sp.]